MPVDRSGTSVLKVGDAGSIAGANPSSIISSEMTVAMLGKVSETKIFSEKVECRKSELKICNQAVWQAFYVL